MAITRPLVGSTVTSTATGARSIVAGAAPGSAPTTGEVSAGGVELISNTPVDTTDKLYQASHTLKWNGANVGMESSISGTTGKLAKFTSATAVGDSVLTESGGNVASSGGLSDSVGSMATIRAGGIGIASQAQYDMVYASSATQLARVANGTTGQLWTATTSGAPSWQTPAPGVVVLLRSGTGTSTSAGVTTLDSFSVTGVGAKDTIHVYASAGCPTNNINNLNIYDSTTSTIWGQTGNNAQSQSLKTETMRCKHAGSEQLKTITMSGSGTTLNVSTYTNDARDITSTFTLALRWDAIGGGDTGTWTWQVWKVVG